MKATDTIFRLILYGILVGLLIHSTACKKNGVSDGYNSTDKNAFIIKFNNQVEGKNLILNSATYQNGSGEAFIVSRFNYFISNLILQRDDGTEITFSDYYLIRQSDANSLTVRLKEVPAGNYKQIRFRLGVDSLRNLSDLSAQTGALDVAGYGDDNMYTGINYGFVILKLEGTSPVAPIQPDNVRRYSYLVTGFGGGIRGRTPNNTRLISLSLPGEGGRVRRNISPNVFIHANILKLFDGPPNRFSLMATQSLYSPQTSQALANNFQGLFTLDRVENVK